MSPADATDAQPGATGTSSTPPRPNATAPESTLKSTPNSRGAAVISSHIGFLGVDVNKLRPWIERDIEEAQGRPVDDMLRVFLQRASDNPKKEQPDLLQKCLEAVLDICNAGRPTEPDDLHASGIREALGNYVSPGKESAFYAPFVKAANIAFACLAEITVPGMRNAGGGLDIICQQNDPKLMFQTHQGQESIRKPDVVIIPFSYDAFPGTENVEPDPRGTRLVNARNQPKKSLLWKDVLVCIEFKRSEAAKKKAMPKPKDRYTVAKYVATKPEYRRVEPVVPEASATGTTGASQTQSGQPQAAAPVVESRRFGQTSSSQPASSQSNKRKADEPSHSSKRVKVGAVAAEPKLLDVTVQTGLYAAEMFAANLAVKSVVNLIVVDDVIWIWYYDRQGTIQSSGINFIQDLPRFLVLLYALQRFPDLGRNTAFTEENGSHKITIPDERFGSVDLELHTSHEDKVTNYGLKGRATNVFPVTSKVLANAFPDAKEDGMVAKIFWAEEQRTSEPDILKKVEEIASSSANVKDHIPDLFWYHKFDEPTSEIRKLLGFPEPKKGSRVLYILVFRRLRPITELYGKDFFNVWQQCILCHFDLWQGGVYHRDISSPNLMWRKDKNGNLLGVLNDYDLSSLRISQGPQGNERTGTVPFMALELLTKEGQRGEVGHLYRHDLESFMWVLAWVCLRYKDGKLRTSDRPLDEWATNNAQTVCEKKAFFLLNFWTFKPQGVDQHIWSLMNACFWELTQEGNRRTAVVMGNISALTEETAESIQSDEEIPAEEVEVADDVLLRKFTKTKAWVKLQKSLQP